LNVLEQHSGFIFTCVVRWMQYGQTEFSVPTNQISRSHIVKNEFFYVPVRYCLRSYRAGGVKWGYGIGHRSSCTGGSATV